MVFTGAEQLRLNQFLAFVTGKEDTDQLTEALDTILTQAEQKVVTADENSDFRKLIRFLIVIIII